MDLALSDAQKLDWLQLIRSENVGPRTFRALINKFGGARAALDALPDLLRHSKGARKISLCARATAEREYEATRAIGAVFVAMGESVYSPALRAIEAPPPLLIVKGDVKLLTRPCCALVGSRNASGGGLALAENLARSLGREGLVVVSGLARGIDGAAHRASIATGAIGVLAGGLNKPYPAEHAHLAAQIAESGALVTEMPLDAAPRGRDFPRRNRIVSGLSLGVIVVEATRRSGSLITAQFARDQGRELFAVPGSPLDPRAEGPNNLLRQGANFCMRPEDVIQVLRPMIEGVAPRADLFSDGSVALEGQNLWDESDMFGEQAIPCADPALDLNEHESPFAYSTAAPQERAFAARDPLEALTNLLGPAPVALDDLMRVAGLSASDMHRAILELELAGRIERYGGNRVSLRLEG